MQMASIIDLADQVKLIEILNDSIELVFKQTFAVDIMSDQVIHQPSPVVTGDISGVIGLVQNFQEGNLILSFPQATLSVVLENIYKRKFDEIDQSMLDAAGEITNMVYGQFKTNMNERGHGLQMALPTIITSENHKILQVSGSKGYHLKYLING